MSGATLTLPDRSYKLFLAENSEVQLSEVEKFILIVRCDFYPISSLEIKTVGV